MMVSVVTEETRLYLCNAYELFSLHFVLLVIEKTLAIPTNLTNPGSASIDAGRKCCLQGFKVVRKIADARAQGFSKQGERTLGMQIQNYTP